MLALLSGLLAGSIHVFSGPDHLAAVAPLSVSREPRAYITGVRWGLGHAGGVAFVGVLFLLLRESLPLEAISSVMERLVGAVLIGIGVWGLRQGFKLRLHAHERSHGSTQHVHIHVHDTQSAHQQGLPSKHLHTHAAFAVGTLHGFAGSSHFFGIPPALAFPTRVQALTYIGAYAIGTIVSMGTFSYFIAGLATSFGSRSIAVYRAFLCSCSCAALVVGGYWLVG